VWGDNEKRIVFPQTEAEAVQRRMRCAVLISGGRSWQGEHKVREKKGGKDSDWEPRECSMWAMLGWSNGWAKAWASLRHMFWHQAGTAVGGGCDVT
jgi:hypothetical protein